VRWEQLFADLEAQWAAAAAAEFAAEVADRTRSEVARTPLVDRLRAARGQSVRLELSGGAAAEGTIAAVGPDWLLVREVAGAESLIALAALTGVRGLSRAGALAAAPRSVAASWALTHVLRQVARDREPVVCTLVDGSAVVGTLDRVAADHVELAEHPGAPSRRAREVSGTRLIPTAALACIRRGSARPEVF
jgi:hypothetical protein